MKHPFIIAFVLITSIVILEIIGIRAIQYIIDGCVLVFLIILFIGIINLIVGLFTFIVCSIINFIFKSNIVILRITLIVWIRYVTNWQISDVKGLLNSWKSTQNKMLKYFVYVYIYPLMIAMKFCLSIPYEIGIEFMKYLFSLILLFTIFGKQTAFFDVGRWSLVIIKRERQNRGELV